MRILLVGGTGQVGHELLRSLASLGEVIATTRTGTLPGGIACERLDLVDTDAIAELVARVAPAVIVNAAAYTAVDKAEDEEQAACRINRDAPASLAAAAEHAGIPMLHYSTDYVFDGSADRPLGENDAVAPLGIYGRSKLAGEQAVAASGAEYLILRTAWVYGLHGSNFLRTMLRLGAERDELRVVADQVGSPTPAWLIADVTAEVLRQGIKATGVRHLVSAGQTSWHGFAEAIFEEADALGLLQRKPRIVPIPTAEFPTRAVRPRYSVLDSSRLCAEYGLELPEWRNALRTAMREFPR